MAYHIPRCPNHPKRAQGVDVMTEFGMTTKPIEYIDCPNNPLHQLRKDRFPGILEIHMQTCPNKNTAVIRQPSINDLKSLVGFVDETEISGQASVIFMKAGENCFPVKLFSNKCHSLESFVFDVKQIGILDADQYPGFNSTNLSVAFVGVLKPEQAHEQKFKAI